MDIDPTTSGNEPTKEPVIIPYHESTTPPISGDFACKTFTLSGGREITVGHTEDGLRMVRILRPDPDGRICEFKMALHEDAFVVLTALLNMSFKEVKPAAPVKVYKDSNEEFELSPSAAPIEPVKVNTSAGTVNLGSQHPIQPLVEDARGITRFKENKIVSDLLDKASEHGFDMNKIALGGYAKEDRRQFAQLIGYSLSGYGDLSYVDDASYELAAAKGDTDKSDMEVERDYYRNKLRLLKNKLRSPVANLFDISPDDLGSSDES